MMKLFTNTLSLFTLAARRAWHQRFLLLCLLIGLLAAVGLLSSIPLYADAVQNRVLQGELTEAGTYRPPFSFLWRYIGAWNGDITWADYQPVNTYLTEQATAVIDLPVDDQFRHVATAKIRLFPDDSSSFNADEPLIWAGLGFVTGLEEQIELVEGRYPAETTSGATEIMVTEATAVALGLQLDETYTLFGIGSSPPQIPVRLVGIWRALDSSSPFWFYQPEAFDEILLTTEAQFVENAVPLLETPVSTAVWYQLYDGGRVRPATVSDLLANVNIVEARVTALLNGTTLDASPVTALQNYGQSNSLLTLTLTIFSLPVMALILYFMALIAGMVVRRDQSEIAVLRSRGTTRGQITAVYLLEGVLISTIGLAGGLWLGQPLAILMGQTRTFLSPTLSAGDPLVPVLSTQTWQYALAGVALVIIALLIPALRAAGHTIVTMRQQQARALQKPFWQRYFLDLLLLIPPLYGWYQLERQGTITLLGDGNDPFANPLLFLVPILFCFSLALVAVRFFPVLMRLLAGVAAYLPGTTLLLTLRQLARSAGQYTGPLLLLSLTISLAVFTASMAVTLDDHLFDRIYYQVGADLNLAELGENTEADENQPTLPGQEQAAPPPTEAEEDEPRWLFLPVSEHLQVDGVEAAVRVGNYEAISNIGGRQQNGRVLGIDRVDFSQVAYYRPDFANNESLGGLMNRLAVSRDNLLISRDFMARHSLHVGDPIRLTIGTEGEFAEIPFTVAGPLDLFPSQYPQDGPFFVANLDYIHEGFGEQFPYNVWLKTDPQVPGTQIVESVRDLGLLVVTSSDARANILTEQTRPERQGLFGLLSVGFLAAAVLTVLGFLVYAVVSFQQRFIQLGMLRAVGLSVTQMAAYLAAEQAALILAGIGLGSALGIWASRLFIPFLQIGNDKTALIPPFVVHIAWEQLGTIYMLFGLMFVIAVLVLIGLLIRMKLFEAVKLGETI